MQDIVDFGGVSAPGQSAHLRCERGPDQGQKLYNQQ